MTNPILQLYIEIYEDAWESYLDSSWYNILWRSASVGRAYNLLLEAKANSRLFTKP